jgi:thiosulfate/3-mercaptopyruvate sulfurtransferase
MRTLAKRSVLLLGALAICAALTNFLSTNFLSTHKYGAGLLATVEAAKASDLEREDPWSPGDLMQPEELAGLLTAKAKPAVLQVGIIHLYKMGHIPGSNYAGPASAAEGLDALKKQAQGLDRNSQVVCYCGCCPWVDCPNTRPAYQALREMGFKKIKMLYLPNNFTQDWSMKGYPVEKSS